MKNYFVIGLMIFSLSLFSQGGFSPGVGELGCTGIHKDSSIIKSWANTCKVIRGYQNILNKNLGKTSVGDSSKAIGIADNIVVSLGDRGEATLQFDGELFDGPGPDFAVFENGFDNYFLELAFVEVSSDGVNFFRFPSQSLTDNSNQVRSFDSLDATNLHNLAGKYSLFYGVPFDLADLNGTQGLDISKVTHVKIIDVVGSIRDSVASRDVNGRKINDPFPTAFPSGGFDLDAVAAIHIKPTGIQVQNIQKLSVYPNPSHGFIKFEKSFYNANLQVFDLNGRLIEEQIFSGNSIDLNEIVSSLYFIKISTASSVFQTKIFIE